MRKLDAHPLVLLFPQRLVSTSARGKQTSSSPALSPKYRFFESICPTKRSEASKLTHRAAASSSDRIAAVLRARSVVDFVRTLAVPTSRTVGLGRIAGRIVIAMQVPLIAVALGPVQVEVRLLATFSRCG